VGPMASHMLGKCCTTEPLTQHPGVRFIQLICWSRRLKGQSMSLNL
jgi:hypothetical protein